MDQAAIRRFATTYCVGWAALLAFAVAVWWPLALLVVAGCCASLIGWGPLAVALRDGLIDSGGELGGEDRRA